MGAYRGCSGTPSSSSAPPPGRSAFCILRSSLGVPPPPLVAVERGDEPLGIGHLVAGEQNDRHRMPPLPRHAPPGGHGHPPECGPARRSGLPGAHGAGLRTITDPPPGQPMPMLGATSTAQATATISATRTARPVLGSQVAEHGHLASHADHERTDRRRRAAPCIRRRGGPGPVSYTHLTLPTKRIV